MPTRNRPISPLIFSPTQGEAESGGTPWPSLKRRIGTEADPKKAFATWEFLHAAHADYPGEPQFLWMQFVMPDDFTSANTCHIVWMADATSGTARWGVKTINFEEQPDDGDTPYEQVAQFADVMADTDTNATEARRINRTSISLGGVPAAGKLCVIGVYRDAEHANDDLAAVAEVLAVYFTYTGS